MSKRSCETPKRTGEMKRIKKFYQYYFAQFLLTLKFIFLSSYEKLFPVIHQATIYIFRVKRILKEL